MIYGEKFLNYNIPIEESVLYGRYDKKHKLDTSNIENMKSQLIKCAKSNKFSDKDYKNWTNSNEDINDLKEYKLGYCYVDDGDDYIVYCFSNEKFYDFDHENSGLENIKRGSLSDKLLKSEITEYYAMFNESALLNEALIADGEKRRIFNGTRKAINQVFSDAGIKAKVSIKYHDKYFIINKKFLFKEGDTYVYMITCGSVKDGKGPIVRWINSNMSSIKKSIEKEIDFKISSMKVVDTDGSIAGVGYINLSIKYNLGY